MKGTVLTIVGMAILLTFSCSEQRQKPMKTFDFRLMRTEWKGMCIGDTVFYSLDGDTATCIIKKISFRPHMPGDLLAVRDLDGKYYAADESHFSWIAPRPKAGTCEWCRSKK